MLQKELSNLKGIKLAFIYGSVARGREDVFSDIDIMIIGNVDENDLLKYIQKVEKELSREINYVILVESDLEKNIRDNDVFFRDVIRGKKIFLIGNRNDLEKIIG